MRKITQAGMPVHTRHAPRAPTESLEQIGECVAQLTITRHLQSLNSLNTKCLIHFLSRLPAPSPPRRVIVRLAVGESLQIGFARPEIILELPRPRPTLALLVRKPKTLWQHSNKSRPIAATP